MIMIIIIIVIVSVIVIFFSSKKSFKLRAIWQIFSRLVGYISHLLICLPFQSYEKRLSLQQ